MLAIGRRIFATTLFVDASVVEPQLALRCTIGVALPLVLGASFDRPGDGVSAAAGALCTGFASAQGVYRTRAYAMLATAFGMGFATLLGGVAGTSAIGATIATAVVGYAYGVLSALGPAATAAAVNSLIALIVFGHLGLDVRQSAVQAGLVALGGIVQTLLLGVAWPFRRYSAERSALAAVFRGLGDYARALAGGSAMPPSPVPLVNLRDTLADSHPFARRGDVATFAVLLVEAERLRGSLAALAFARDRLDDAERRGASGALRRAGTIAAPAFDEIAAALLDGRAPEDASDWRTDATELESDVASGSTHLSALARAETSAFFGQLRSAWRTTHAAAEGGAAPAQAASQANPERGEIARRAFVPALRDAFATIRANLGLDSQYGRLAVRLAATLSVAVVLGRTFSPQYGYWIAITVALVLRPDFTTTLVRGVARILGTILGAFLAALVIGTFRPDETADAFLAIAFAGASFFMLSANYALYVLAITGFVVFELAAVGRFDPSTIRSRLVETLVGGVLAQVVTLAFPTFEARGARLRLAEFLDAQRANAVAVLSAIASADAPDDRAIDAAQRRAWAARAAADASVDRLVLEPERRIMPSADAIAALEQTRRFGLTVLALGTHRKSVARRDRPELGAFASLLARHLDELASALRESRPPEPLPSLRDAFATAARAFREEPERDRASLLDELDVLVDSVNSITSVLRDPATR